MYVIMADYDATGTWEHLYWQGDEDYVACDVKCDLQIGDSGSLELGVPKSNPGYSRIKTRKTLLDFRKDGTSLGVFEVRELSRDVYGTMEVYAVGEMAWLFDSVQPQREYHDLTSRQFIGKLLEVHNAQCPEHAFSAGIVDVTDSNDSLYRYTNYEQTLDAIRDKLVDRLGGNLRVRHKDGVRYLDYVSDDTYGSEAEQSIRFGENILDYSDNFSVEDICTEVVPLGARLENDRGDNSTIGNLEKRLTIEGVNGGNDYITNDALVQRFGHIRTTRTWDDVTIASNLLGKARAWLDVEQYERMHITVRAIDLSMSSSQFGELRMGDYAYVVCEPFGLKARYLIRRRTYNPNSPENDEIEVGDTERRSSFVASQVTATRESERRASDHERLQTGWLADAIENVTAMMTGSRGGYKITEYDEDGRWVADYIMDSPDRETAKIVKKVTVYGTAYSHDGIDGDYTTAIMADGTILGEYIQAGSIKAEQISTDYTSRWENADAQTLNTVRTELNTLGDGITAEVSAVREYASGVQNLLDARIQVVSDAIESTVKRGEIGTTIKQTEETVFIEGSKFGWDSDKSSLSTDGVLRAHDATLTNALVSGTVIAGGETGKRLVMGNSNLVGYNERNEYTGHIGSSVDGGRFGIVANGSLVIDAREILVGTRDGGMTISAFTGTKNGISFVNGICTG